MFYALYHLKESYSNCGRSKLETCYPDYYDLKYDALIGLAGTENLPKVRAESKRGRKKKGNVLVLIERLAELKNYMLLFVRNFEVSFTDNAAERAVRNLKIKSRGAGNFRSEDGARWYLRIHSYIDSAGKYRINAFEAAKLDFRW